eukprot:gene7742-621_t
MEDNISNTYDSNGEEEEDADVVMENEEEIQDALLKRDPDNGISDDVVPHDTNDETDISLTTSSKNTTKSLFLHWKDFIFDVISEIQSPTQPISTEVVSNEPNLSRKLLAHNFKRFRKDIDPIITAIEEFQKIIYWENPYLSLIIVLLYSFFCLYNILLHAFLVFALSFLTIQHFRQARGSTVHTKLEDDEKERSLIERARAVKETMTTVQNQVGEIADALERLQNLFLWNAPEQSSQLFFGLLGALLLVLFTPEWLWMTICKIVFGVRVFIKPGLYHNYPRLREKYDKHKFFGSLPTHKQVKQRKKLELVRRRQQQEMGNLLQTDSTGPLQTESASPASPRRATTSSDAAEDASTAVRPRSESTKKVYERSEGDSLSDFGVPLIEQVIETNACFLIPEGNFTKIRRGRLWVTDTYFCFIANCRDDSFCYHLSRLNKSERTGKVLGSKGLMIQMTFSDSNGATVTKTLSGILNPTSLINAISRQKRLLTEQTSA